VKAAEDIKQVSTSQENKSIKVYLCLESGGLPFFCFVMVGNWLKEWLLELSRIRSTLSSEVMEEPRRSRK